MVAGHIAVPQGFGIGVGKHVSHPNTGIPVSVESFDNGYPKTVGALHGASGAQFIGKLIHPPPPNPQLRPSTRFLVIVSRACAD